MASKQRDYVEIVVRVYDKKIDREVLGDVREYFKQVTVPFLHSSDDYRRPRVVSVKRVRGGTR
jgi:hypothetical protein